MKDRRGRSQLRALISFESGSKLCSITSYLEARVDEMARRSIAKKKERILADTHTHTHTHTEI